jgi:hypothetical protein
LGIGRQQASKDINSFQNDIALGNLAYDKSLKGIKPTADFIPKIITGYVDEYLLMLSRSNNIITALYLNPLLRRKKYRLNSNRYGS